MFQHYFKIGWRNLVRQKMYTLINLAGLTIGMTCFILIAFFIQNELSFDRHHEKADRTYRVAQQQKGNVFRGTDQFAVSPQPLAPALREHFPEVEAATTFTLNEHLLYQEDEFFSSRLLYADQQLFDVFTINIVQGVGADALQDPDAILLSRSLAEKCFGTQDPIGQTLLLDDNRPVTVGGIFEDFPKNQHFAANGILPLASYPNYPDDFGRWVSNNYRTYLVLKEGHDYRQLEKGLSLFDDEVAAAYANFPFKAEYFLQPMLDIYLYSNINLEIGAKSDIRYVYLMASIGLIILLLAAVNYMNLATARSARRAKEIGVRKVMGALRKQVIGQILGESFLLTTFSFILAIVLTYFLLPGFNQLLDQNLAITSLGRSWILVGLLVLALAIGGLSGLYPAWMMSAASPVNAFRGKVLSNLSKGVSLRNALIVGQFMATVFLAVSSVVVYQQLQYIRNKKLGFNRDHIVYVPFYDERVNQKLPSIREELLANTQVQGVTVSRNFILNTSNQGIVSEWEGNHEERDLYCYRYFVDEHFLDLYEIPVAAGRNFSPAYPTDSTESYLLNETAVHAIGWTPQTAIGKTFRGGKVIGVVKDFHFQPMDLKIEPLFIKFRHPDNQPVNFGSIAMKVQSGELEKTLAFIRGVFEDAVPRTPLEFRFLDESFEQLYSAEKRLGLIFNVFTGLSLFIACLGLFGLVSYQIVQRTKEIGIRKVLGASAATLVTLLSKDFLRLVAIALILAIPLAWYGMQQWLNNFAYRIEIKWWVFLVVIVPALTISLLTVGIQSLRAALSNPVEALKEE